MHDRACKAELWTSTRVSIRARQHLARIALKVSLCMVVLSGAAQIVAAQVTPSPTHLLFNPATVGQAASSAQQLTVTFTLGSSYTGPTPTAALHYGLHYSLGALSCEGAQGAAACTLIVTFNPILPGDRKDAILLMNGATRLSTVLLDGVGDAPLALVQPGNITHASDAVNSYFYQSVSDENGTVYFARNQSNSITSVTKAGVVTQLPIMLLYTPEGIAIDGAGVLYFGTLSYGDSLTTYDTVQQLQGTANLPVQGYFSAAAVAPTGDLYAVDYGTNDFYQFASGAQSGGFTLATSATLRPAVSQPTTMVLDAAGNIFIGGGSIDEVHAAGNSQEINTNGGAEGLSVDAADTLYATRYISPGPVYELPASNYSTTVDTLDAGANPLGVSVSPDGTVMVSNYDTVDIVDRSLGTLAFGVIGVETQTAQTFNVYNGGNQPLNITAIALSNTSTSEQTVFSIQISQAGDCTAGTVLTPGELCSMGVSATTSNGGEFTGAVTVTSNSLNNASSTLTIALSALTLGAYLIATPQGLTFGYEAPGTTSAPQTVALTNVGYSYAAGPYSPSSSDPAFNISLGSCAANVAVGATCQLSVTYSPTLAQADAAVGVVEVNNIGPGNSPPVSFKLGGTAVPYPLAQLSPSTLAFASTAQGATSMELSTILSNSGLATLSISGITITGSNAASFSVSASTCGSTLAAGGSCAISVTFTPASAGSLSALLSVVDNAIGSPQTVSLIGNSTAIGGPIPLAINETIHTSDADAVAPSTLLNIAETLQLTDTPGTTESTLLNIAETLDLTDEPSLIEPTILNVRETLHVTDALTALSESVALSIAETIHLSNAASPLVESVKLRIAETIHVSDALPKLVRAINLSIAEIIHVADARPALSESIILNIPETIRLSNTSPALVESVKLGIAETIHVSDALPKLVRAINLSIAEIIHVADARPALGESIILNIPETIRLSNTSPALVESVKLGIAETIHISDALPKLVRAINLSIAEIIRRSHRSAS